VHDLLADGGGYQGLQHAEDAGGHGGGDHSEGEQREQPGAALGQRGVDDLAQQEGGGDPDKRGGGHQQADEREAGAVGVEEADDAAYLGGRLGRGGVVLLGPRGLRQAGVLHGLLR
jgi:hypothetical protein